MLHYRYLDIIEPTIGVFIFIRWGQNRYLFFTVSVYRLFHFHSSLLLQLRYNYDTSHCKCFQCCLFWLPTPSTDLFPLAFSWLRFVAAVRASIVALLIVHSFGIGRGLLVRAFFGCTCAKFPRVWILFTTDGRTGILSEMTGKLCFARLNQL